MAGSSARTGVVSTAVVMRAGSMVSAKAEEPFAASLVRESPAPYGDAANAEPSDRSKRPATEPVPDPFEDAEALDEIEDRVIKLAAHIHAAEHRLLVLIAEFDKRRGWEIGGHRNCTDWLHAVTGLDRGAAGQRVRAARALEKLPQVGEAMSRGELSFSKVRAIGRLHEDLSEEAERVLVDYAKKVNAADLERVVRNWGELTRVDEAELERIRHRKRTFSVFPGDDGMYLVRGVVDPEVGALLMRTIEAASDALYEAGLSWSAEGGAYGPTTEEVTSEQRRADALALVAERAMAAGFGIEVEDERDEEKDDESAAGPVNANSLADAEEPLSDDQGGHGSEPAVSGGRAGSAERSRPAASASAPRSGSAGCESASGDQTGSAEHGGPARAALPNESEVGGGQSGGSSPRVSAERDGWAPATLKSQSGVRGGESGIGRQRVSAERAGQVSNASTSGTDKPAACRSMQTGRASPPLSGTRSERYMVVVHVSPSTLRKDDEVGRSNLQDGTRISAETARRLSCDCSLVHVTRGERGEVLNVGRKRRTISPALRRALEIRDGGCRFPGCGSRFCDGHHIVHWEDGGETCLDNLCLLCRTHHRAVHEERFSVRMLSDGTLRFQDGRGWPLPDYAPPLELGEDPVEALIRQNRATGVDPDGWACSARYDRSADIPWDLEASLWDALDRL